MICAKMLYIICNVRQILERDCFVWIYTAIVFHGPSKMFFMLCLLKSRGESPGEFSHISVLH